ncbi:MAG: hypothetical protein H0W50_11175 [Parachlamydiaceae bacterium]|nr:hypothetical protein [Parachlamydiaceae bacterium]
MNSINQSNNNVLFSVYIDREFDQIKEREDCLSHHSHYVPSCQLFDKISEHYTNDSYMNITVKEYTELKNVLNLGAYETDLFNYSLLEGCRNADLISEILKMPCYRSKTPEKNKFNGMLDEILYKEKRENTLFKINIEENNNYNRKMNDILYSQKKEIMKLNINKCMGLINLGVDVNHVSSVFERDFNTALLSALDYELDDSYLELLILAGGVVYEPLTTKQQNRINNVMLPIINKVKVMFELFLDKGAVLNVLPIELKSIIYLTTFTKITAFDNKLTPEFALKILKK